MQDCIPQFHSRRAFTGLVFLKFDIVPCVKRLKKGSFKRHTQHRGWTEILGEVAEKPLEDHFITSRDVPSLLSPSRGRGHCLLASQKQLKMLH